ncbi:hypothetical protein D3Z53_02675 [Lachnospiraceae bacterium]|nr:hypothetical protein [Lachnospiraceae bacterium]
MIRGLLFSSMGKGRPKYEKGISGLCIHCTVCTAPGCRAACVHFVFAPIFHRAFVPGTAWAQV